MAEAQAIDLVADAQHQFLCAVMRGAAPHEAEQIAAEAIREQADSPTAVAEAIAFLERLAERGEAEYPAGARLCRTLAGIIEAAASAPKSLH